MVLDDTTVKFEIWDTAGQERYHSLAPMYYRGAQAAIVVYDITNADTFTRAKSWVGELHRQARPDIVIALGSDFVFFKFSSLNPLKFSLMRKNWHQKIIRAKSKVFTGITESRKIFSQSRQCSTDLNESFGFHLKILVSL